MKILTASQVGGVDRRSINGSGRKLFNPGDDSAVVVGEPASLPRLKRMLAEEWA